MLSQQISVQWLTQTSKAVALICIVSFGRRAIYFILFCVFLYRMFVVSRGFWLLWLLALVALVASVAFGFRGFCGFCGVWLSLLLWLLAVCY